MYDYGNYINQTNALASTYAWMFQHPAWTFGIACCVFLSIQFIVFMCLSEGYCWVFKINRRIELQNNTIQLLEQQNELLKQNNQILREFVDDFKNA